MVVLDTCAIVFKSLAPERLSKNANMAIDSNMKSHGLACSDISIWEIAMLIDKKRLNPGTDFMSFINCVIEAMKISILSITPKIANVAVSRFFDSHKDPADRIIASTAICYNLPLVTCDEKLATIETLQTIW